MHLSFEESQISALEIQPILPSLIDWSDYLQILSTYTLPGRARSNYSATMGSGCDLAGKFRLGAALLKVLPVGIFIIYENGWG